MHIDPWILAFSSLTVLATVWMGFWSARKSKTTSDFFVAGRSVSVGWNASAISGEYLSAASFMGVAGMVMSSGYDALWYPVCYACGYLFLLLFIAGPLRRFGAYTIPDFAEGRFDSPVFRKIAVVFVLFIGFFYTMPQMKGAGTTLAYIFPGLPYWAGVVLVGAVITLNVALGGMKGITLVQAFQYWAKMFAISVPIFVLMAVYGHYGKQVELNQPKGGSGAASYRSDSEILERLKAAKTYGSDYTAPGSAPGLVVQFGRKGDIRRAVRVAVGTELRDCRNLPGGEPEQLFNTLAFFTGWKLVAADAWTNFPIKLPPPENPKSPTNIPRRDAVIAILNALEDSGARLLPLDDGRLLVARNAEFDAYARAASNFGWLTLTRKPLPGKAPVDATWLNPFGPLTTKAAKAAAAALTNQSAAALIPLRSGLSPTDRMTANLNPTNVTQALAMYGDLTGRQLLPRTNSALEKLDEMLNHQLSRWQLVKPAPGPDTGLYAHGDGYFTAGEVKTALENFFRTNGVALVPEGPKYFHVVAAQVTRLTSNEKDQSLLMSAATAQKTWLAKHERPLALLYTYSLIIALVCGTAGLPHILVRFYTNPDGVAAKRTTMWVMILIGVFYLFPPVFGVMGRNLLPDLYSGVGAKGTDKVVLELPRILNEQGAKGAEEKRGKGEKEQGSSAPLPLFSLSAAPATSASRFPWGSLLSGITCAGAFAAFMSTFSGLLVSMTGALAHDVYGRMLRPKSTQEQRLRAFKICAVIIGGIAILLGTFVEPLQINFMVGQAFAIAAASYFPLLFMSAWWRGMTMRGAAAGMLTGGICALAAVTLTNFSDLGWVKLANFWAAHPLLRILCEQPAIWTVPLAIGLMIVVSKLTRSEVPSDIRMKMLVLHAPEKLGLKQEYIQEHQHEH